MIFSRIVAAHRALLSRLRGGELSPERLGGSVALGLFVGILPIYGFHFPVCAALAFALRLDLLITYAAANISIPPMIPFLLYGGLQLGSLCLTGSFRSLSLEGLGPASVAAAGLQLGIGSVLLATIVAVLGGGISYLLARAVSRRRAAAADASSSRRRAAIARTAARYRGAPRGHRYYVASKLRLDPLTAELFEAVEAGAIHGRLLDVGAGRGQFSLLLAELGAVTGIVGFDHDAEKIEVARQAAAGLDWPVRFEVGDLRAHLLGQADTVLLLDVLHYLPVLDQDAVLERVVLALRPGGSIYLRETNRQKSRGARWAVRLEKLARLFGINRGERLVFRSPGDYAAALEAFGLEVEQRSGRGTLDNVLLVARAARESSAAPPTRAAQADSS